ACQAVPKAKATGLNAGGTRSMYERKYFFGHMVYVFNCEALRYGTGAGLGWITGRFMGLLQMNRGPHAVERTGLGVVGEWGSAARAVGAAEFRDQVARLGLGQVGEVWCARPLRGEVRQRIAGQSPVAGRRV